MILESIQVGPLMSNCYLFGDEKAKEICVIDPGGDSEKIMQKIMKSGFYVKFILLTHGHFDHIGAVEEIQEQTKAKVMIGENEKEFLTDDSLNLVYMLGKSNLKIQVDGLLKEGDTIEIGSIQLNVLETPGHTKGGICFVSDGIIFTGDTLFFESIGRTDFPTGNFNDLILSLRNKLAPLPDSYKVCPGHGEMTTIRHEKQNNPYFTDGQSL